MEKYIKSVDLIYENNDPITVSVGDDVKINACENCIIYGKVIEIHEDSIELDIEFSYSSIDINYDSIDDIAIICYSC